MYWQCWGKVVTTTDLSTNATWGVFNDEVGSDAQSTTDGAANTQAIVTMYPDDNNNYAANICSKYTVSVSPYTYDEWYLPAICEMGYDAYEEGSGCGFSSATATLQNIQSSLVGTSGVDAPTSFYWSSTEYATVPQQFAWVQYFAVVSGQNSDGKGGEADVRCVREFR